MNPVTISLEFFPPKTDEMTAKLWQCIEQLAPLSPDFVSVTYGAGGSTRERTHTTVKRIVKETALSCAAHLTCIAASKEEVDKVAHNYWDSGIRHIVALRGDPPDGNINYEPATDGYRYASDLVAGLRNVSPFEISVAAYPETHPEAKSAESDLENLKRKLDAGAVRAITQFFFENSHFLKFRDRAFSAGINVPIIPGIMPVTNFSKIKSFAQICGTNIPNWLSSSFENMDDDQVGRKILATDIAAQQCEDLIAEGVNGLHFYTLNRADLISEICSRIGILPAVSERE